MATRTHTRTNPNLLEDAEAHARANGTEPDHITRYGADALGRALGHAIAADHADHADHQDGADPWRDYGRLLWPAVASSPVMPPFARLVDAASDVLDA
jgi:hypothetical protein